MTDKSGANLAGLQRINVGLKFSRTKQRIETPHPFHVHGRAVDPAQIGMKDLGMMGQFTVA